MLVQFDAHSPNNVAHPTPGYFVTLDHLNLWEDG